MDDTHQHTSSKQSSPLTGRPPGGGQEDDTDGRSILTPFPPTRFHNDSQTLAAPRLPFSFYSLKQPQAAALRSTRSKRPVGAFASRTGGQSGPVLTRPRVCCSHLPRNTCTICLRQYGMSSKTKHAFGSRNRSTKLLWPMEIGLHNIHS